MTSLIVLTTSTHGQYMHELELLDGVWLGSPRDKRILKPTIPGSQGQASSTPTHSVLVRKARTSIKLMGAVGHVRMLLYMCSLCWIYVIRASPLWSPNQ